ncbi:MAG: tRNA (guanosine(37)-N1)-methyltransferase TrmD [Bdellovibrionales bacterium]|nr:tRNA (guanosine(37)-N1)-methyltransferase TrmD [Bdellovibrionales bacterium]
MACLSVEILSLFPEIFNSFLETSLVRKALDNGLFQVRCTNIRDFADPPHYRVDDVPYGGGGGMLLRVEPLAKAIEDAQQRLPKAEVVLLTPSGSRFQQSIAQEFCKREELILICGRYEGVDQRIIDLFVDYELSIGDYVLMGGELPAMVVLEGVLRLRSEVLGNQQSALAESFADGRTLEAPHYTRPEEFRGAQVPEVLLSGNHQEIKRWRQREGFAKTKRLRPDLVKD